LSNQGIGPTESRVEAVIGARVLQNAEEVQSFLGLGNFSARFIPNFASIAEPLHRLTRKQTPFECKNYIKYVGIYLDEHLQWGPQTQHVNNKLAKNVGIINKLRYYLDFHMLKQLDNTLIYPYLDYGLASWGAAYKTRLNKICTKQNKCIRSMFFALGREHVNPYYNLLGILKFENIYRLKVSLFTYKFKNDKSNTPAVLRCKPKLWHIYV